MVNSTTTNVAYAAGAAAYHADTISLEAWHLYDKLVFWAGKRGYCWHKVATLAELFGRSARHVGRWLKELVTAGLIRRVRRGHTSSETHITALSPQTSFFDAGMSDHDQTPMSDHTIKSKGLNGGGETSPAEAIMTEEPETPSSPSPTPPASPVVAELRAAGLVDERTIADVATKPLSLIRQAVAYCQRHGKGPGLIAWLLRNNVPIPDESKELTYDRRSRIPAIGGGNDRTAVPPAVSIRARSAFTIIGLDGDK